ncbi:uncharacterized protein LOC143911064 [Arctopsyche grandis]|uniref:uncharacterized protein LOC143911064 n=1 Tax=Arctopsyche grandis TaxID=121162 RepID=UPI00406D64AA
MKFLLVVLSLVAMSQAATYVDTGFKSFPFAYPAFGFSAPLAYFTQPQVVAPIVQPGYVAATRGSLHIAPLPDNTPYASHHLNLAPAPGTI